MKTHTIERDYSAKVSVLLNLSIILFLSMIAGSLGESNIVKSLPGYPGDLSFSLETGYIGVAESEQVQLFYYFVKSERNIERDPLILWLTGGPGCSGLSAIVFENGPLRFNLTATNSESIPPKLQRNPYSWTKVASMIFLDSPAGTGFSYATTHDAFYSSDTLQSTHVHEFIRKWLIRHPEYTSTPLYVGGDSYSGMVVPVVVQDIIQGNEIVDMPKLNFKGYLLGNPVTNVGVMDNARYKYAHHVSLLSDELYKTAMISCNGDFGSLHSNSTKCLRYIQAIEQAIRLVNLGQVNQPQCPIKKSSQRKYPKKLDPLHLLPSKLKLNEGYCRHEEEVLSYTWANNKQVREALHVREGTKDRWNACNSSLAYTHNVGSAVDYHRNSSGEALQVLIYSGDQDMIVPYLNTLEWIKELEIPVNDEWRPWFADGQIAGYTTEFSHSYYRLTFTTIKGGSHVAPDHNPRECLAMVDRWLSLSAL